MHVMSFDESKKKKNQSPREFILMTYHNSFIFQMRFSADDNQ